MPASLYTFLLTIFRNHKKPQTKNTTAHQTRLSLAVTMREVSCVEYILRTRDPRSLYIVHVKLSLFFSLLQRLRSD